MEIEFQFESQSHVTDIIIKCTSTINDSVLPSVAHSYKPKYDISAVLGSVVYKCFGPRTL